MQGPAEVVCMSKMSPCRRGMRVPQGICGGQDNLSKLLVSFYSVGSRDQTQVTRLEDKHC